MKNKYTWLRRLPVMLGIGLALLLVIGIYLLQSKFQKPPQTKKVVQQITMIQPPPPPPPPPEQAPPPEPEVKEEKIEEPEPEQEPEPAPEQADEPPAGELGLDADGTAGSDGFGLAAHKGGRSILGGSGGSALIWYGGQVKRQLEDGLQNLLADTPAMKSEYSVLINIWVDADGKISRTELASVTGNAEVDQALRNGLAKFKGSIGKPLPENTPQPFRIRYSAKI